MANPEIIRESVGGVWETNVGTGGGGPAGPVTAGDIDSEAAGNGEVLTADGAGGASWAAGGGSQPDLPGILAAGALAVIDGGTLTMAGLLNGPVVIYTPGAGVEVWAALISDFVLAAGLEGPDIRVGWYDASSNDIDYPLAVVGTGDATDTFWGVLVNETTPDGSHRLVPLTDPITVIAYSGGGPITPGGPWEAATTYHNDDESSRIVMEGHVWYNDGATGASGASEPDFAGNIGGSVADSNGVNWADAGTVPTDGSITVRLLVAKPATTA